MKKLALLLMTTAITMSAHATTTRLTNFDELVTSLRQGDDVKAIISLDNCQQTGSNAQNATLTGAYMRTNFTVFNYYKIKDEGKDNYAVATSLAMLIEHTKLGPVEAYGRVRIWDDNSISLHVAYYDPHSYVKKGGADFQCHLGKDSSSINLLATSL